jgi:hypothetical protein
MQGDVHRIGSVVNASDSFDLLSATENTPVWLPPMSRSEKKRHSPFQSQSCTMSAIYRPCPVAGAVFEASQQHGLRLLQIPHAAAHVDSDSPPALTNAIVLCQHPLRVVDVTRILLLDYDCDDESDSCVSNTNAICMAVGTDADGTAHIIRFVYEQPPPGQPENPAPDADEMTKTMKARLSITTWTPKSLPRYRTDLNNIDLVMYSNGGDPTQQQLQRHAEHVARKYRGCCPTLAEKMSNCRRTFSSRATLIGVTESGGVQFSPVTASRVGDRPVTVVAGMHTAPLYGRLGKVRGLVGRGDSATNATVIVSRAQRGDAWVNVDCQGGFGPEVISRAPLLALQRMPESLTVAITSTEIGFVGTCTPGPLLKAAIAHAPTLPSRNASSSAAAVVPIYASDSIVFGVLIAPQLELKVGDRQVFRIVNHNDQPTLQPVPFASLLFHRFPDASLTEVAPLPGALIATTPCTAQVSATAPRITTIAPLSVAVSEDDVQDAAIPSHHRDQVHSYVVGAASGRDVFLARGYGENSKPLPVTLYRLTRAELGFETAAEVALGTVLEVNAFAVASLSPTQHVIVVTYAAAPAVVLHVDETGSEFVVRQLDINDDADSTSSTTVVEASICVRDESNYDIVALHSSGAVKVARTAFAADRVNFEDIGNIVPGDVAVSCSTGSHSNNERAVAFTCEKTPSEIAFVTRAANGSYTVGSLTVAFSPVVLALAKARVVAATWDGDVHWLDFDSGTTTLKTVCPNRGAPVALASSADSYLLATTESAFTFTESGDVHDVLARQPVGVGTLRAPNSSHATCIVTGAYPLVVVGSAGRPITGSMTSRGTSFVRASCSAFIDALISEEGSLQIGRVTTLDNVRCTNLQVQPTAGVFHSDHHVLHGSENAVPMNVVVDPGRRAVAVVTWADKPTVSACHLVCCDLKCVAPLTFAGAVTDIAFCASHDGNSQPIRLVTSSLQGEISLLSVRDNAICSLASIHTNSILFRVLVLDTPHTTTDDEFDAVIAGFSRNGRISRVHFKGSEEDTLLHCERAVDEGDDVQNATKRTRRSISTLEPGRLPIGVAAHDCITELQDACVLLDVFEPTMHLSNEPRSPSSKRNRAESASHLATHRDVWLLAFESPHESLHAQQIRLSTALRADKSVQSLTIASEPSHVGPNTAKHASAAKFY